MISSAIDTGTLFAKSRFSELSISIASSCRRETNDQRLPVDGFADMLRSARPIASLLASGSTGPCVVLLARSYTRISAHEDEPAKPADIGSKKLGHRVGKDPNAANTAALSVLLPALSVYIQLKTSS